MKGVSRFFEKGYSEKGNGRGYGLYNVKGICKRYGMHIECAERNLEGANFLVFRIVREKKPVCVSAHRRLVGVPQFPEPMPGVVL